MSLYAMCIMYIGEESGRGLPRELFLFWGFEMRILVHSPAHLSISFWTNRPGPDLQYARPV